MKLTALSISTHTNNILSVPQWTVHSTFTEVCNLIAPTGEICALVSQRVGNAPLNIVVQFPNGRAPFRAIAPGTRVRKTATHLHVGAALTVDLTCAAAWNPRPDWGCVGAHIGAQRAAPLRDNIAALRAYLSARPPAASFAALLKVRGTFTFTGTSYSVAHLNCTFIHRAKPAAWGLLRAITAQDAPEIAAHATALAGLGVGLTPAGDDFLAGVMAALWFTATPNCPEICWLVLQASAKRTTDLSRAFLQTASAGMFSVAWHALFTALTHEAATAVERAAARILSYGATSGADMLTGFVFGTESMRTL